MPHAYKTLSHNCISRTLRYRSAGHLPLKENLSSLWEYTVLRCAFTYLIYDICSEDIRPLEFTTNRDEARNDLLHILLSPRVCKWQDGTIYSPNLSGCRCQSCSLVASNSGWRWQKWHDAEIKCYQPSKKMNGQSSQCSHNTHCDKNKSFLKNSRSE